MRQWKWKVQRKLKKAWEFESGSALLRSNSLRPLFMGFLVKCFTEFFPLFLSHFFIISYLYAFFVLLGTTILHLILWIHEQNNSCLYIFIVLYTLRFLIRPCWTLSSNYLLTKNELSTFAQPRKNLQAFNHRGSQFLVSPMNLISHPLN